MLRGSRSRARIALFAALSALVSVVVTSTATPAQAASASFVGPLVSRAENANTSWGRDGGYSVPLPNGKVFFVFGDTPRYTYSGGKWKLSAFLYGSSAGVVPYKKGKPPKGKLTEVIPGKGLKSTNKPHQFLSTPRLFMPNGSKKVCNKANGGSSAGAARWPTGATLMPDKKNILITYVGVCVLTATNFRPQSWGFAEFNWKTNRFTVAPTDAIPAKKNGAAIPQKRRFGSPIVLNGKVTFFSNTCCASGSKVYTATTTGTSPKALRKVKSYTVKPVNGLASAPTIAVVPKSKTQPHLTMYRLAGDKGQYNLLKAASPSGPWKKLSSGTLPKCNNSPGQCISVSLHPALSTSSKMLVSYFLPGFGPGVPKQHPYPHPPLGHVVFAYIPG
jgi:hypothetical protein